MNLRITFVESAGSLTMKENEVIMWCHIVVSTRKKHDQDESFKTKCLLFYWQHTCSKKKKGEKSCENGEHKQDNMLG